MPDTVLNAPEADELLDPVSAGMALTIHTMTGDGGDSAVDNYLSG
jgi:hypothetical protein